MDTVEESVSILCELEGHYSGKPNKGSPPTDSWNGCARPIRDIDRPRTSRKVTPDPYNVYEKALKTLDAHFLPKLDIPYEQHLFHRMRQEDKETVDLYVARLRQQGPN